jgi:autotransporter translocation and assembly factor TamB
MRSRLRRVLYVLAGCLALFGVALLGSWLWLKSESGNAFVRERITTAVADRVDGALSIGALSGAPLTGISVHEVGLEHAGESILRAQDLLVSYRLWDLILGRRALGIDLRGVVLTIRERSDGALNVSHLWKQPSEPRAEHESANASKAGIRLSTLRIEAGRVDYFSHSHEHPISVDGIVLDASGSIDAASEFDIRRFGARVQGVPIEAKGRATWSAESIDLQNLQVDAAGIKTTGHIHGPPSSIAIGLVAHDRAAGSIDIHGTADVPGHRLDADVALADVDPSAFGAAKGRISAMISARAKWGDGGVFGPVTGHSMQGEVQGNRFERGSFDAELKGHAVDVSRAGAVLPAGVLTAKGRVGFNGEMALDFTFKITDASQLGSVSSWLVIPAIGGHVAGSVVEGRVTKRAGHEAEVSIKSLRPGDRLKRDVARSLFQLPGLLRSK